MMLSLTEFVGAHFGTIVGDTAENRGQCVGLIELWLDNLGKPHIWGNAKDLLDNAPTDAYTVIRNAPDNYPQPGDIFVWGASWGGGYGHTAVVLDANVKRVAVVEQNNPAGAPVLVATHDYSGALGWLRPR